MSWSPSRPRARIVCHSPSLDLQRTFRYKVHVAFAVQGLTKRYGARLAVDGLTFEVAAGSIFALVGPNGSGKTTTVECMEGLRRPDAGAVRILGMDPFRDRPRLYASLGVQLQDSSMHARLRLREALWLFAAFH